jgi:hypothetical protein
VSGWRERIVLEGVVQGCIVLGALCWECIVLDALCQSALSVMGNISTAA